MCTVTIIHLLWCPVCHIYLCIRSSLTHQNPLYLTTAALSLRGLWQYVKTACPDRMFTLFTVIVLSMLENLNINAKIRTGCLFILIRDCWITPHWVETHWHQMIAFKSLHLTSPHNFCCYHLCVRLLGWWMEYLLNWGRFEPIKAMCLFRRRHRGPWCALLPVPPDLYQHLSPQNTSHVPPNTHGT